MTVPAPLFAIFDSDPFRKKIAVAKLGNFGVATLSDDDYHAWIDKNGLNQSFLTRYVEWLRDLAHGHLGLSLEKRGKCRASEMRVLPQFSTIRRRWSATNA